MRRDVWITGAFAVLAAMIGSLATAFLGDWLGGPREGLFVVDVTSIRAENVDAALRDQIARYPIFVELRHTQGPPAKNITVTLQSTQPLENLELLRQDDHASAKFADDGKSVTISIPELRKSAVVKLRVQSKGSPDYKTTVLASEGAWTDRADAPENREHWYLSPLFYLILVLAVLVKIGAIAAYVFLLGALTGTKTQALLKDFRTWIVIAFVFLDGLYTYWDKGALLIGILLLVSVHMRISRLEGNSRL